MKTRTEVYQLFDHDGVLIYVGMTTRFGTRMSEHRGERPWWGEVDESRTVRTAYASATEAACVEQSLIAEGSPRNNVLGVTSTYAPGTPAARERLAERRLARVDPIDYTPGEHVRAILHGVWRHADVLSVDRMHRVVRVRWEMHQTDQDRYPDQVRRFRRPYTCEHERP